MPRKPVRGRFLIVVPLVGGGSWKCETVPERSLTAKEIVSALREYAGFVEKHFVPAEDAARAESKTESVQP